MGRYDELAQRTDAARARVDEQRAALRDQRRRNAEDLASVGERVDRVVARLRARPAFSPPRPGARD